MKRELAMAALAIALAGCKGGGGDGEEGVAKGCVGSFAGGAVQGPMIGACSICGARNMGQALDGVRDSFGVLEVGYGSLSFRAVAPAGAVFPAGRFAGALMRIPVSDTPGSWSITTYLGDVPLETRTPENAEGGDPALPSGEDELYGFRTTMAFDTVELMLTSATPAINNEMVPDIRVYEFCSAN